MSIERHDVEGDAWNEQRELLQLAAGHAIAEWWKFTGCPGRAEFNVQGVGRVVISIEPDSRQRVS